MLAAVVMKTAAGRVASSASLSALVGFRQSAATGTSAWLFSTRGMSTKVSVELIKKLRGSTGAPMMECKAALSDPEVNGDLDLAADWLRKKGVVAAGKKADRTASDGLIGLALSDCGRHGALVEVNSETDFVARNELMQQLVDAVAKAALDVLPAPAGAAITGGADEATLQTLGGAQLPGADLSVADGITDLVSKVRENIVLRRAIRISAPESGFLTPYIHNKSSDTTGTIGVLVGFGGLSKDDSAAQDLAKQVSLHIAAASPRYLSRDDVPPGDMEKERDLLREEALASGKPANIVEKMIDGRMRKFFQEYVLLDQACVVREDAMVVGKMVESSGGSISNFVCFRRGGQ